MYVECESTICSQKFDWYYHREVSCPALPIGLSRTRGSPLCFKALWCSSVHIIINALDFKPMISFWNLVICCKRTRHASTQHCRLLFTIMYDDLRYCHRRGQEPEGARLQLQPAVQVDTGAMMEWDPTRFFRDDIPPTPFALLVLNQPINEKAFSVLREHGAS